MTEVLPLFAAGLLMVAGLALATVGMRTRRALTPIDDLLAEFDAPVEHLDSYSQQMRRPMSQRVLLPLGRGLATRAKDLLPRQYMENLRERLVLAGLAGRWSAEEHLAAQIVAAVVGLTVAFVAGLATDWTAMRWVSAVLAGGVVGAAIPALAVKQARDKRVQSIEKELPDVLDLLAISVEAGVGLEGALRSVSDRFRSPLADELAHTLSEMELGASRKEALQHLRERTQVPDLDGFVLSLLQAHALGMPLTRVLQAEAAEMRRRRRQKVREAAAKLPVKLIFPLIFFIMPALFVIVIGPGAIRIARSLLGGF